MRTKGAHPVLNAVSKAYQSFCVIAYYAIFRWLPESTRPFGAVWRFLRYWSCHHLFLYCGKKVNIETGAYFGLGSTISIGHHSGIGICSRLGRGTSIGCNVMMGRDVLIISRNHMHARTDIPMNEQGFEEYRPVSIGDDVWIGDRVIILPGVHIGSGCIIGAGAVVTKDVADYSVAAGNPAAVVRSRRAGEKIGQS